MDNIPFSTIDYIIDFLFLADLILGFFTTFLHNHGHEEKDSREIFYHHTGHKGFYVDFLSICGNSLFQKYISHYLNPLRLFKLFRIFKINTEIVESNVSEITKIYAILGKLVLYLLLWFHILACGWWIVLGWNANI